MCSMRFCLIITGDHPINSFDPLCVLGEESEGELQVSTDIHTGAEDRSERHTVTELPGVTACVIKQQPRQVHTHTNTRTVKCFYVSDIS